MLSVSSRMEKLLVEAFEPSFLSILDESARHAGHSGAREGGESHYRIEIVSKKFAGQSRVDQHRMVYEVIKPFMDEGVHAIAIDAEAPEA